MCSNQEPELHPNPRSLMSNLRQPMPLGRKVRFVVRNMKIKVQTRQNCCGHPGEPGCCE